MDEKVRPVPTKDPQEPTAQPSPLGRTGEIWGMLGVFALVGQATARLTPIALEALRSDAMGTLEWVVCAVWVVVNAHAEGYRGFHRKFVPRTVARARYLARHPTGVRVALAPFFCMGLFDATRRVRITAWSVVVGVTLLIVWVRSLAQPWRGIVDAGVVVGLGIGLLSLAWTYWRASTGRLQGLDPCMPGPDPSAQ